MTRGRRAVTRSLLTKLERVWRELRASMTDPYRPERHYMRGPGPKAMARRNG